MNRINVMHIIGALDAGGAELTAINLVNFLPREGCVTHLCTTRCDGPLADLVAENVGRLHLQRRQRFDIRALFRLTAYIRQHRIQILHAHGTSLFIAVLASLFPAFPKVVWHDNYGRYRFDDRPVWLYRLAATRISAVIAVNHPLAEWARKRLCVPAKQVWYIPNFVCKANGNRDMPDLPGRAGERIVCVANFRPEKDHPTLLRAMTLIIQQVPTAHLLLIGAESDKSYLRLVQRELTQQGLDKHVSLLGQRRDVAAILRGCDIGVLSSASEGLPLALLEYGMAALPSVATAVGQCSEVLDDGRAGVLIPSAEPTKLAEALLSLLRSHERRAELGEKFRLRVQEAYSAESIPQRIRQVYDAVLRVG